MNPKEYLKKAEYLRRRIKRKEYDLRILHSSAEGMSGRGNGNGPRTASPDPHKTENAVFRIIMLEKEIQEIRKELETLVAEMRKLIEQAPDCDERDVLRKRYLEFKTWSAICKEMNCSEATCYRLHRSGLVMLKI
jgi:DNA-directed RNA polymerase specialized sigma24 family protein